MNDLLKIVLLSFSLLISQNAFAQDQVDVNAILACDVAFNPNGCVGRSSSTPVSELRHDNGIVLQNPNDSVEIGTVRQSFEIHGSNGRSSLKAVAQGLNDVVDIQGTSVSSPSNGNIPLEERTSEQSSSSFQHRKQEGGDFHNSSINGHSTSQGQTMVQGGLLYSNDSQTSPQKENQNSNNRSLSPIQKLNNGVSAIQLNQQNSGTQNKNSPSKSTENSPHPTTSAFASGSFDGGTSPASAATSAIDPPNSENGLINRLSSIAKNLGSRFFGLSGSQTSGRRNQQQLRDQRAEGLRNLLKTATDPDFRNLLIRQLRDLEERSLASQGELGTSHSLIFKTVCQQYQSYAHQFGIEMPHTQSCPSL